MKLTSVTVFIEYRIKAGGLKPTWKSYIARVRQKTNDPDEPFIYGRHLVRPTETNIDAVICKCLVALENVTDRVRFEFEPIIGYGPREYFQGKIVAIQTNTKTA